MKKQHLLAYTVGKLDISRLWLGGDNKNEILKKIGKVTLCEPISHISLIFIFCYVPRYMPEIICNNLAHILNLP